MLKLIDFWFSMLNSTFCSEIVAAGLLSLTLSIPGVGAESAESPPEVFPP